MYDRSAIMTAAWARARADRDWTVAYDWTPGVNYGARRAPTLAERQAVFAKALRAEWAVARFLAREATKAVNSAAAHRIHVIECRTDRLTRADVAEIDALRRAA